MKVVTEEHLNLPCTERGWYVINDEEEKLAGPFVWFGDAGRRMKQIEGELR